jgi:AcrR family transcriptional regulator
VNVPATPKYEQKRQTLIAAASAILNRKGVAGMTLAEVGAAVGFNTTSVTYYFRKKEDLAAACILDSVGRLRGQIARAAGLGTPAERARRLLELWLEEQFAIYADEAPARARFNSIRALTPAVQAPVIAAFNVMFGELRQLLEAPGRDEPRRSVNARANLLLEQLLWSVAWLPRYDAEDRPRLCERMFDILQSGLTPEGADWAPRALPSWSPTTDPAIETFLQAATRLINEQGYRGASVEKISASLNVTKGSFYHHYETKDELVVACFERTYDIMRHAQRAALAGASTQYEALASAAAALVGRQLSEDGPLLRSTALSVVPEPIREVMLARAVRVSDRFAAMISDGIADGSIRPVDPTVAAFMILGGINAVADLPKLAPSLVPEDAVALYARRMLTGVLRG